MNYIEITHYDVPKAMTRCCSVNEKNPLNHKNIIDTWLFGGCELSFLMYNYLDKNYCFIFTVVPI